MNNVLQQNQEFALENQRLKAEVHRMEDLYGGKISELETQIDF